MLIDSDVNQIDNIQCEGTDQGQLYVQFKTVMSKNNYRKKIYKLTCLDIIRQIYL